METVKLNGQEITREEFEIQKQKLLEQTGVQLVESSPGEYRTRLRD